MGRYFIGIDLGTSSVRAFLIDFETGISTAAQETYETLIPQSGYAEQDPEIWYQKTCECIRRAIQTAGVDPKEIEAVSFSGQMHGLVALTEEHKPVMNAVVWLDQRSGEAINEIYEKLGAEFITKQTQNRIAAGFMVSTLYWLKTR
ncbi:MAG: FGGY family carbohydrate kinase, partial [Clostridia bacterium]|nr:FGGY family carbohydrate kinase [Clostridia bacterium]